MIKFTRHAKRKMRLYDINIEDVKLVIDQGERELLSEGKISATLPVEKKSKYPLRVVFRQGEDSTTIITAYPLKRGRK